MDPRNWIVALKQPAVVHDVLRHPVEGGIPASEKEAHRLFENNLLDGEPQPATEPDDDDGQDEGDGLDGMTVADLHILVTKESVALHDATKKADIIAAIRKHRDEKSA